MDIGRGDLAVVESAQGLLCGEAWGEGERARLRKGLLEERFKVRPFGEGRRSVRGEGRQFNVGVVGVAGLAGMKQETRAQVSYQAPCCRRGPCCRRDCACEAPPMVMLGWCLLLGDMAALGEEIRLR